IAGVAPCIEPLVRLGAAKSRERPDTRVAKIEADPHENAQQEGNEERVPGADVRRHGAAEIPGEEHCAKHPRTRHDVENHARELEKRERQQRRLLVTEVLHEHADDHRRMRQLHRRAHREHQRGQRADDARGPQLPVLPRGFASRRDGGAHDRASPATLVVAVAAAVASISIVMATSSPSARPPWSSTWLKLTPKSLRWIVAVAVKPARRLPHGSFAMTPPRSTSSTTSRVAPRIVRSPVTARRSLPFSATRLLTNRMRGCLSASKKSPERRCASRCGSCVSTLATSISTSTRERVRSCSSSSSVAVHLVKRPRTLLTSRWRTVKSTLECAWSKSHLTGDMCPAFLCRVETYRHI